MREQTFKNIDNVPRTELAPVSALLQRRNPPGTDDDHMCAFRHPELTRQTFGRLKAGDLPIPNADFERMSIK
jgi:hypothetical protein